MSGFTGKVAIITGGASGIGRALGEELAGRGARVVLADRNGAQAQAVAGAITAGGGAAQAATVDVCDAGAVLTLVTQTATAYGQLDYLFNNAGIALAGRTRDMTVADWNRLIDVNVRGVVHGVMAAYPLMITQGFGHIVNTASVAGLAPAPGFTAYAATKHAVVGLSTSLRSEAARHGVRVSAVCPGFIDTPIKDTMPLLNVDRAAVLKSLPVKLHSPVACARAILRGVERNQAIIVVTAFAKLGWLLYRLSPALITRLLELGVRRSPLLAD
ncbi:MAG: SDR family NAD(P)-dependent oxidoreductase [Deltaproteobacteria bacterium]|nr:SDR family NAD(P)-dependent oxidoreductase [Deltaproteobacteria bacterium]